MTTTPATFPNELLAYLEVAVSRPLGPGAVAHRAVYHTVTRLERGYTRQETLTGAACQPTTTHLPGTVDRHGHPVQETIPATPCGSMSAGWAQSHGATRCTDLACYPLPDAQDPTNGKPATKRTTKRATKATATKGATKRRTGGAS